MVCRKHTRCQIVTLPKEWSGKLDEFSDRRLIPVEEFHADSNEEAYAHLLSYKEAHPEDADRMYWRSVQKCGIWFPDGTTYQIPDGLLCLGEDEHVAFLLMSWIARLKVELKRVRGGKSYVRKGRTYASSFERRLVKAVARIRHLSGKAWARTLARKIEDLKYWAAWALKDKWVYMWHDGKEWFQNLHHALKFHHFKNESYALCEHLMGDVHFTLNKILRLIDSAEFSSSNIYLGIPMEFIKESWMEMHKSEEWNGTYIFDQEVEKDALSRMRRTYHRMVELIERISFHGDMCVDGVEWPTMGGPEWEEVTISGTFWERDSRKCHDLYEAEVAEFRALFMKYGLTIGI